MFTKLTPNPKFILLCPLLCESIADSHNKGHNKINLGFGVNLVNTSKIFKNHRIGIEGTFPIYQNLRGLQMQETFRFMVGWQYAL